MEAAIASGRECHYAWDGDCILPGGRVSSPTVREGSNRLAMLRLSPPPYVAALGSPNGDFLGASPPGVTILTSAWRC